jgi:flagellar hook-associated protein 3 FlgL
LARTSLDELLSLLNTQAGDRYLFSGRATDTPAVETMDHILNGNGAQAGLKQLISERNQADLGASGLGRLTISAPTATSISVDEDAVSPFGFKLASISSNLTNGVVGGPAGAPPSVSIDLTGGNPNDGDTVTLNFTLPDGTSEKLTLTATATPSPGANQFAIGATPAATTANLQAALTAGIGKLAGISLAAASAVAAANDFFSADANNPPQRVDGPPFDSATVTIAGSAANTVIWYTGEAGSDPARSTATAQIDSSLSVAYGARANESGLRKLVQNIATLAAVTISPSASNAVDLSNALNQRLTTNLNDNSSGQSVANIQVDLGNAQAALGAAQTRHRQTSSVLSGYLEQISGLSTTDIGVQILTLQTRLQASMQTTALLFQTSLVNYL